MIQDLLPLVWVEIPNSVSVVGPRGCRDEKPLIEKEAPTTSPRLKRMTVTFFTRFSSPIDLASTFFRARRGLGRFPG
jgi:hypothetical protein